MALAACEVHLEQLAGMPRAPKAHSAPGCVPPGPGGDLAARINSPRSRLLSASRFPLCSRPRSNKYVFFSSGHLVTCDPKSVSFAVANGM